MQVSFFWKLKVNQINCILHWSLDDYMCRLLPLKRPSYYLLDSFLQETWVDAKDTLICLLMKVFLKASINVDKIFR